MDYGRICKLIGYLYDAWPDTDECQTDDEKELLRRIEEVVALAHIIQKEKRPKDA
jgi:hypothetical protein